MEVTRLEPMTLKEEIERFMRGESTQGGFNRTFGYYGVNLARRRI